MESFLWLANRLAFHKKASSSRAVLPAMEVIPNDVGMFVTAASLHHLCQQRPEATCTPRPCLCQLFTGSVGAAVLTGGMHNDWSPSQHSHVCNLHHDHSSNLSASMNLYWFFIFLFFSFFRNLSVFTLSLSVYFWEKYGGRSLGFSAEFEFWRSDWLKCVIACTNIRVQVKNISTAARYIPLMNTKILHTPAGMVSAALVAYPSKATRK